MLKLKVLLTKMAEMLKNLSDNKVDMTSPIYNYNTNATTDDDDYNLTTAINNLNWINNIVTDTSNPNKISVKKMFTKILDQIKINSGKHVIPEGGYDSPRISTSYQNTDNYTSWLYVYQQGNLITCQGMLYRKTSTTYLNVDNIFVIPDKIAPSTLVNLPACYQTKDGSFTAWRVEVESRNNNKTTAYIKAPTGFFSDDNNKNTYTRVLFWGSWIIN